ncbi:zinc metallopeptidase [Clostridia bacterium]|nr:zinc metallopeptidase [Clostridia bacterium]
MPFYMDYWYVVLVIPAIIFAMIAQATVSGRFNRYSAIRTARGLSGAQAAAEVLRAHGVSGVKIEPAAGKMTDHYDPRDNTIRLSQGVYDSVSVAAVGIAAHEAGHAVQYAQGYSPIKFRQAIIPVTQIGSTLSLPLILIGLFLTSQLGDMLFLAGVLFFALATVFQLLTLPVEFDASRRAMDTLGNLRVLDEEELRGAKQVLGAAAMTYVAALAVSLAQLVRLLLIFGGRRRD